MNHRPQNFKGENKMLRCCDWCGAYTDCEKCDDPKVAALMDGPDIPGVFDDPMDEEQGGHIHACVASHLLYWEDGGFSTSLEGLPAEEIRAMLPTLHGVRLGIAVVAFMEAVNDEEKDCDCVVDPEDGSTWPRSSWPARTAPECWSRRPSDAQTDLHRRKHLHGKEST
jgi:hypothetical protein